MAPLGEGIRVLILKATPLFAEMLRLRVEALVPTARVTVAHSVEEAAAMLATGSVEILLTGIVAGASDVIDALAGWTGPQGRVGRVLVMTNYILPGVLYALASVRIMGVLDERCETPEGIDAAMADIIAGRPHWNSAVRDLMTACLFAADSPLRRLTATQRLVLAVVGDGCDNATAAGQLGMSTAMVNSTRRDLHRILHVQHKGELIRRAMEFGLFLRTPFGVCRPGLSALVAARRARKQVRAKAVAACSGSMQWQHAVAACSGSMQWQHAVAACSGSMTLLEPDLLEKNHSQGQNRHAIPHKYG